MKFRFLIPILPVVVLSATAASIQTSVRCEAGPQYAMQIRTSTTSCQVSFAVPEDSPFAGSSASALASARADDSVQRAGYAYGFRVETLAEASATQDYPPELFQLSALSEAASSLTEWFTTRGPIRDGFIGLLIEGYGGQSRTGLIEARAKVGPYSGVLREPPVDGLFPFRLGVPFLVELSSHSSAENGFSMSIGHGDNEMAVYFTLYEADGDGLVPVQALSVPEPAGTAIIGILLMSLRLLRGKRRK